MRRTGLGLGLALLILSAGGLGATPSATAQPAPGEDSVTGSALVLDDPCTDPFNCGGATEIDARSGPSGENPSGSAAVTVYLMPPHGVAEPGPTFTFRVTCLKVEGNRASIGATGDFGSFIFNVEDGGGAGQDRFAGSFGQTATTQCPAPSPPGSGIPVPSGDFTVHDAAPSAPSVLSVTPPDSYSGASRTAPVLINFDQAMDEPSVEAAFSLKRGDGAPVSGSFSWSANSLSFTPSSPLAPGRLYRATVGIGARSLGGIHLPAPVGWTFSTNPQPLIASVSPADKATGVSKGAVVVVGFDAAMDKPSAQAAFSLTAKKTGVPVSGSFGWYGNALIFKPGANLAAGTYYEARERNSARNLAGRPLLSGRTWGFTTAP